MLPFFLLAIFVSYEFFLRSVKVDRKRKVRRQHFDLAMHMSRAACHRTVHTDFRRIPALPCNATFKAWVPIRTQKELSLYAFQQRKQSVKVLLCVAVIMSLVSTDIRRVDVEEGVGSIAALDYTESVAALALRAPWKRASQGEPTEKVCFCKFWSIFSVFSLHF